MIRLLFYAAHTLFSMLQTRQIIRFAILAVSLMFIGSIPAVDASKELSCGNFFWEIDSSHHSNNSDQSWNIGKCDSVWLIWKEFYAPWDETGKKLDIMWSSLAEKTDVNFGRVQFHKCKVLAKYLGIEVLLLLFWLFLTFIYSQPERFFTCVGGIWYGSMESLLKKTYCIF